MHSAGGKGDSLDVFIRENITSEYLSPPHPRSFRATPLYVPSELTLSANFDPTISVTSEPTSPFHYEPTLSQQLHLLNLTIYATSTLSSVTAFSSHRLSHKFTFHHLDPGCPGVLPRMAAWAGRLGYWEELITERQKWRILEGQKFQSEGTLSEVAQAWVVR